MRNRSRKAARARLRKFLQGAARVRPEPSAAGRDPMTVFIESVLEADAPRKAAAAACQALLQSYVDLNELRVATPREMADCWPAGFPGAAAKAQSLARALNAVFERSYQMSLESLKEVPHRELRKHLLGLGLSPYAAARLLLVLFEQPAVPVDASLVEALELEGHVPRGASVEDVQHLLGRLVPARSAPGVHAFLRSYVERSLPALERKRKKEAQTAARAEHRAALERAKAEALARAKAEDQAKADAAVQAQARSDAKAKVRQAQARKVRQAQARKVRARKDQAAKTPRETKPRP